jgi:hypothetical protein
MTAIRRPQLRGPPAVAHQDPDNLAETVASDPSGHDNFREVATILEIPVRRTARVAAEERTDYEPDVTR